MRALRQSAGGGRPLLSGAAGFVLLLLLLGMLGALPEQASAAPDVSLSKVAGYGDGSAEVLEIYAGDRAEFTISATNNGSMPADIMISDPLPGGAELNWQVDWSPNDYADPQECEITGEGGAQSLSCQFDQVPAGEAVMVNIWAWTGIGRCSTYSNQASVTATDGSGTVELTDGATVNCDGPEIELTKIPGSETVVAGQDVTFTMTFTNTTPPSGEDPDPGTIWASLYLIDELPGDTAAPWEIVNGPEDGEGNPICGIYESEGEELQLSCGPLGDLAPGESFVVTVRAPTSVDHCSTYHNTAEVYQSQEVRDPLPAATAEATVTCRQQLPPILALTNTAQDPVINPGEPVSFTVVTSNPGDIGVKSPVLTNPLPDGTAGPWQIATGTQAGDGFCQIVSGVLTCSYGNLGPGEFRSVTVRAPTSEQDCGTYLSTAAVSAIDVEELRATAQVVCQRSAPNPGEKPVTKPRRKPTPKLQLRVKANRAVARPGQRVRWTVSVRNRRKGSVAKNLRVCDRIAPRMVVTNRGGGRLSRGRICWNVRRLRGKAPWIRFHYTTRVDLNAPNGKRTRDGARVGNLEAHAVVKIKAAKKRRPGRKTPVTG
ncbi:MAG: DUF11 domain-containing protein [Solirubrobacterales bacterium]|nr:DUF11 domain-containing protein [Solirubrobacterales bacterium]